MKYQQDVLSTAIGANSYANGALSSVTGAFSIISSKYDGSGGWNTLYATQNIGATIYGSLNSIESNESGSSNSGIANSVIGFANRTANANAALIWGTGNEITNSSESVSVSYTGWSSKSVSEAQRAAIAAMQSSDYAGGSVVAIGGGNKADGAFYSQLMGVQNKITGASAWDGAYFDLVDGYRNSVDQSSYVTVIGMNNTVNAGADYSLVLGNYHAIAAGKTHNVIIGDADEETTTSASNTVIIGHNANSTVDGGVAIGSGSVASTDKGAKGWSPTGSASSSSTWVSTAGAVSVGGSGTTRQITNVAAGTQDTDAVNVAQLKAVNDQITTKIDASKTKYYSVNDSNDLFNLYLNKENDGATQLYGMAAGMNTSSQGIASTVIGSNSVIGSTTGQASLLQGATAIAAGSFNLIQTTGGAHDGVANSVVGQANITQNANAALIYGAGNTVTNSYEDVDLSGALGQFSSITDPAEMVKAMQEAVGASGGKVMAMGGLNTADYAKNAQLIGVKNTLKGSDGEAAEYDLLDGFENTVTGASHVSVIGSYNTVNDGADSSIIIGDSHEIAAGKTGNVIIGSADEKTATSASDSVIIGRNANSTADGGVAIGSFSVADTAKSTGGYNALTGSSSYTDGTSAWASSYGAVSVGSSAGGTRQITNVAAGTNATDAVNVAQLMKAVEAAQNYYIAGENIAITTVKDDNGVEHKVISAAGVKSGDKVIDVTPPSKSDTGSSGTAGGDTGSSSGTSTNPAGNYTIASKTEFKGDTGDTVTIGGSESASNALSVKGGATGELSEGNIGVVANASDSSLTVKLAKDVKGLNSVEAKTVTATTVNAADVNATTVKAGDTTVNTNGVTIAGGPSFTKTNIDAAGNQIHNVAAGTADTDAVNVSQLKASENRTNTKITELGKRINQVSDENRAGIASAMAMASLGQPIHAGKSMLSAGASYYKGQSGIAIGVSSVSDNGSWLVKFAGSGNTEGDFGVAGSVNYEW